jgi:hypothetical protein
MSLVLLGSTSGSVTLQEPAIAGSTVIDLPATSGTMAVTSGSPSFTNITATGNLTVNGNTTLGDASTDTILMTGAPSIGGAGLGMGMGFRNRIINGAMVIDQRNAGASVTTSTINSTVYTLDRWAYVASQASKFTIQQTPSATETGFATRVGAGFTNYLACTVGASASVTVGAADFFLLRQNIEGLNVSDLAWGTSSAKAITLSFWAYSSVTGTFGGAIGNSANARAYPFTYSIPTANTWTQISITVAGDTSGTWLTTNGIGLKLSFSLGMGSTYSTTANAWASGEYYSATGAVSPITTNSATFYITGVQLEKGSTATSFDYRPYGTELALCQRYCLVYWNNTDSSVRFFGFNYTTTTALAQVYFPVVTRTYPTGITVSTASGFTLYSAGTSFAPSAIALDGISTKTANVSVTASGLTQGGGCILGFQASGNKIEFTGMEL